MSIVSEISRINNNIADAYTSVSNKNGTLPQVQNSANLSSAIDSIPTEGGGGSAESNDVNFYDYDGTIVHSYSASEFAELTTMPENPTHQGLTAQGWNWSLADAKEYVAEYGMLDVGQMYITDDGKTRIYITLEEGRLEPYLGFAINGTATVDWGDGNTETVTGTRISTIVYTQHSYQAEGNYIITIESDNLIYLLGSSSVGCGVISNHYISSSSTMRYNNVYQNTIKKVELGNNARLGEYSFYYCFSLSSITMSNNITAIGTRAFSYCALNYITVPNSVTSMQNGCFNSCTSMKNISIPKLVQSFIDLAYCTSLKRIALSDNISTVGSDAFKECYALEKIVITNQIYSIGSNAFKYCYPLKNINLPSNFSSLSTYMFSDCYSLNYLILPNKVKIIPNYLCYSCYSLSKVVFLGDITQINYNAFYDCRGVSYYDFTNNTAIPTLSGTNAFQNIPTDCKIIVPDDLYDSWIAATNWSNFANNIVKESEA